MRIAFRIERALDQQLVTNRRILICALRPRHVPFYKGFVAWIGDAEPVLARETCPVS
jgi:hypothetical protein